MEFTVLMGFLNLSIETVVHVYGISLYGKTSNSVWTTREKVKAMLHEASNMQRNKRSLQVPKKIARVAHNSRNLQYRKFAIFTLEGGQIV